MNITLKLLEKREKNLRKIISALQHKYPERREYLKLLKFEDKNLPVIYAVTPTYQRPVQKAELTRLSQTFLHIPNFHWVVVEDSSERTKLVENLLMISSLNYTHLNISTPQEYKNPPDPKLSWLRPRGVFQRNLGLQWLRFKLDADKCRGILYFADDDNTYDLQLFEEVLIAIFYCALLSQSINCIYQCT